MADFIQFILIELPQSSQLLQPDPETKGAIREGFYLNGLFDCRKAERQKGTKFLLTVHFHLNINYTLISFITVS